MTQPAPFIFDVLCDPKPASRPLVLRSGKTVSDRSPELRKWKAAVRRSAYGIILPPKVPLSVIILFGMPHQDKKRYGKLHSAQPDFDNLAKSTVDAMQIDSKGPDMPIDNDGRIASGWIIKIYSPKGFARVIIQALPDYEPESAFTALNQAWCMAGGMGEMCQIIKKLANSKNNACKAN